MSLVGAPAVIGQWPSIAQQVALGDREHQPRQGDRKLRNRITS